MSLTKEVFRLRRKVGKLTDGQVSLGDLRQDEAFPEGSLLDIVVKPNAGLYKGGRFTFLISIPEEYPFSNVNLVVFCNCDIIHPNIDTIEHRTDSSMTNVCLNMLDEETWNNSFGLEGIVHGILFLLHNPNFEDPLSSHFDSCDCEAGVESVIQFMKGEEVEGLKLSRNFENNDRRDDDNANDSKNEINKEVVNIIITDYEDQRQEHEEKKEESNIINSLTNVTDSINCSNAEDGEFDKGDTEISGLQMITIDGEVFLAPDNISNEFDTVETTSKGTNDNDNEDKKEIISETNDIGIVNGKEVVLNENDMQNTGNNTHISISVKTTSCSEFDTLVNCRFSEEEENLANWSILNCMCFNQPRKTTLIDKTFFYFRTLGRKVLLLFENDSS